jgi:rhodanese-related sulfurtransferase
MAERAATGTVRTVDPRTLKAWLDAGEAVVVDVRDPAMHAAERIAGALSVPFGARFDTGALPPDDGRRLVLHCEIGATSAQAAARALELGREVHDLHGGITAWKQAGLPVERDPGAPIPVLRQMQMIAGSLVLLGAVLGAAVSPWFLLLSGGVGAGLLFAGATGRCGMTAVLLKLPYNRRALGGPGRAS